MSRGGVYDIIAAWGSRLNSNNLAVGQLDPDSVGVGPTVSPAFRFYGLDSLKPASGTHSSVEWRSSSIPDGKVQQGLDSISDAEIMVTQWDSALSPFIAGGLQDTTTLTGMEFTAPNNLSTDARFLSLCVIGKKNLAGSIKGTKYLHWFYPYANMTRDTVGTQQVSGTQKNPNNVGLKISPQPTGYFPTGVAFGANQNWANFQEFEYFGESDYPYWLDVWIADGTATTFTLTYKPKKSTVTSGHTDNWVTKNGTPTAPTSINVSTGVVTIPSAGTVGDIWVVMYPVSPSILGN